MLAPLLFLVFINDMFDCVSNNLDAFADDSTLWAPVPSSSHRLSVSLSLNADLVQIELWGRRWLASFNHDKTELMTIWLGVRASGRWVGVFVVCGGRGFGAGARSALE